MASGKPVQPAGRPSTLSLQQAQQNLNEKQLLFCAWLAQPEDSRVPATRKAMSQELGVSEVTTWRWAQDPKILAAVRWLVLQNVSDPVMISNAVKFLEETFMDSQNSMKVRLEAVREFMKAIGVQYIWKSDPELLKIKDVEEIRLDELSDEEVWALYEERAKMLGTGGTGGDS
jgi:hypothetical protein